MQDGVMVGRILKWETAVLDVDHVGSIKEIVMMTVIVKETLYVEGTIVQVHSAGDQQTVAQDVVNALPNELSMIKV